VDSPGLRLIYDCGATLFADTSALDALRSMQPYMVHVHVKNSRRVGEHERPDRYLDADSGIRYTGTLLSEGEIDIAAVIRELRKVGYDGYILIEYQGMDDPREASAQNVRHLRALLDSVQAQTA
jgi:sugar phosphate isomerase/epimerase